MNTKYFPLLMTIVLQTQTSQLGLTSPFKDVFLQPTAKSRLLQIALEPPPPPDRGAPSSRQGAASHAA